MLLAAAGILHERPATTHHAAIDLALGQIERFPGADHTKQASALLITAPLAFHTEIAPLVPLLLYYRRRSCNLKGAR